MKNLNVNRFQLLVFLTAIIFSVNVVYAETSVEDEIKAIENSLIPAVQVKGQDRRFNILDRMKNFNVPGMSIAVIRNKKIRFVKGYGIANTSTGKKVDVNTLFQAGSISKPIAALAALKLVDEGKVDLDKDVNFYLKKWKVAENEFTKKEKVTLRRLLTHTAGMTVHGFPGYSQDAKFPDDVAVLNGKGNTPKIFVDTVPGSIWRYSGGGYTVMEQLVEDVSGMEFEDYLEKKILKPLGMTNSTYAQPLPEKYHSNASAAFNGAGELYKGLWHNYPEQAAAGLWTTPTDLAKYLIEMQRAFAGKSNKVLSPNIVKQMLTKDKNNWGLGPALGGEGDDLTFGHGGKNAGFTNNMTAFVYKGDAVIVMTNADRGGALNSEVQRGISALYKWDLFTSRMIDDVKLTEKEMEALTGEYHFKRASSTTVVKLFIKDDQMYFKNLDNNIEIPLTPASKLELVDISDGSPYEFKKNEAGEVVGFIYQKRYNLTKAKQTQQKLAKNIYDHHVHLMSPRLIKYFKDVGIPFSKPDATYSDFDTVVKRLGTNRITLVSMAYLFGHPEFGKIENEYESVKAENDYVINAREKLPENIKAFCGVNPLKDYALAEVNRCHKKLKADGIKIHSNANQLYLTEPVHLAKIKKVYKYAAENKMPILLHFDNSHPKFGEPDIMLFADEILADIKPATFYIAHFGTSGGFNAKTKRVIDAFIKLYETNPIVRKHRILFDISAVALDKDSEGVSKLNDAEFAELAVYARKLGFENIVFGTDYPLYSAEEYLDILKTRLKLTDAEIKEMLNKQ